MSTKSKNQATPQFERGITEQFIKELNQLALNNESFWSKIIADEELFIAIRGGYLNVYYNGDSICRLWFQRNTNKIIGETHYKYLFKSEYVKSIDGIFHIDAAADMFTTQLSDIGIIKKAASEYAGEEKKGVQSITRKNKDIIDVEITFPKNKEEDKKNKGTNRIDYAALELDDNCVKLVFYEAKRFVNQEIRSKIPKSPRPGEPPDPAKPPKILEQISRYEAALEKHKDELIGAYLTVCKNVKDLKIAKAGSLINRVANEQQLFIDLQPRLVVFDFDEDQGDDQFWEPHKQRLIRTLGKDRLILVGEP